jgi:hypothetical protein
VNVPNLISLLRLAAVAHDVAVGIRHLAEADRAAAKR